jgi:hypothetical protein
MVCLGPVLVIRMKCSESRLSALFDLLFDSEFGRFVRAADLGLNGNVCPAFPLVKSKY